MPNWENLGIAGATLFILFYFGNKIINVVSKNSAVTELCKRIDIFTDTNNELLKLLTQSLIVFEKDQKEIMQNLNQVLNHTTYLMNQTSKIEERTLKCSKRN